MEPLIRFDMEDAMILNKSSVERGLHYGQVYKVLDVYASFVQVSDDQVFLKPLFSGVDDRCAWM